jgi:hypothetical protein
MGSVKKPKAPTPPPEPVEHGPASAHYDNARGHIPAISCLCGAYFPAPTWEDVGIDFDSHLAEVADEEA